MDRGWVKSESGCDLWTNQSFTERITWDGDCKDGKITNEGSLIVFKDGEVYLKYQGKMDMGYFSEGKIEYPQFGVEKYGFSYWNLDRNEERWFGIEKNIDGSKYIGERLNGEKSGFGIHVFGNHSMYSASWEKNIPFRSKSVVEIEKYFQNKYPASFCEKYLPIPEIKTIAIAYFDNVSGLEEQNALIKGLANMLISDLSDIDVIRLVERDRLEEILIELELSNTQFINKQTAQQLGRGLGANHIIIGSFINIGDNLRIDARLVDVESGMVIISNNVEGKSNDIFQLSKDIAINLSNYFNSKYNQYIIVEEKKVEYKTFSIEAIKYYEDGIKYITSNDLNNAIESFNKAIKYDNMIDSFNSYANLALAYKMKFFEENPEYDHDPSDEHFLKCTSIENLDNAFETTKIYLDHFAHLKDDFGNPFVSKDKIATFEDLLILTGRQLALWAKNKNDFIKAEYYLSTAKSIAHLNPRAWYNYGKYFYDKTVELGPSKNKVVIDKALEIFHGGLKLNPIDEDMQIYILMLYIACDRSRNKHNLQEFYDFINNLNQQDRYIDYWQKTLLFIKEGNYFPNLKYKKIEKKLNELK